jgi:multiple sugar transport system ATP-binding protein
MLLAREACGSPGLVAAGDRKVTWSIRPEHLIVASGEAGVPSRVDLVEPTGAVTYVSAHVAGQAVTAAFRGRHKTNPGESVGLLPEP